MSEYVRSKQEKNPSKEQHPFCKPNSITFKVSKNFFQNLVMTWFGGNGNGCLLLKIPTYFGKMRDTVSIY